MKKYAGLVLLLLSQNIWAENILDLTPLQLQYRYEDSTNQNKDYIRYESYGVALQIESLRLGFDFSKQRDQTGNESFNVENEKKDYLFIAGYDFYTIQEKKSIYRFDFFANGIIGSSQSKVTTNLLNASSSTTTDQYPVFGLGLSAVARIRYFMSEVEVRALNSKNFNPSTVFTTQLKLGLTFSI